MSGTRELDVLRKLRTVLKRSSRGMGLAASFVGAFAGSADREERDAVRRILLGNPVEGAFGTLVSADSSSGQLMRFIASLARVDSLEASRGAERLSPLFERWTLLKERRAMESRVMGFRGVLVSIVSGVVVGMLSALAPIISSFQISLASSPVEAPAIPPYVGAAFLIPSAICLGYFLSPKRPYLNVALSLLAFAGVVYFLGPFGSVGVGG